MSEDSYVEDRFHHVIQQQTVIIQRLANIERTLEEFIITYREGIKITGKDREWDNYTRERNVQLQAYADLIKLLGGTPSDD